MTLLPGLRALTIRVPYTPGESLQSWIEAIAARYRMTVRELLPALGLPSPRTPYALVRGIGAEALRSLEWQCGVPDGRLDTAILDKYAALGLAGTPGQRPAADQFRMWTRASGSGFCPRCLAANGGRWELSWHLIWTFACVRHNIIMAQACPACGGRPWSGENRIDHVIDSWRCCHRRPQSGSRRPGPGMPRCGAPLEKQRPQELAADHPLIRAQQWVNNVLAGGEEVTVAGLAVPPRAALAAAAELIRHAAVAGTGQHPGDRPTGSAAAALGAVAADPALFGAAAAKAADVLTAPSMPAAADKVCQLISQTRVPGLTGIPWPSQLDLGSTGSAVIDAVVLRRRAAAMSAADRLTYRTESEVPRRPPRKSDKPDWPFTQGRPTSVPARLVPQAAWGTVTSALSGCGDKDTGMLAVTISMAVVRCGSSQEWPGVAASLGLPRQAARTVTSVLRRLDSQGRLDGVLASVDALVEEMTKRPPPIDYARRRHVFRDLDLLTRARLRRACHDAEIVLTARRRRYATMLLWEMLTGGDVRFHHGSLAPRDHTDRACYAMFSDNEACGLAGYVAVEAERLLLRHRIDEPVAWQPEQADSAECPWRSPPADLDRRLPGWNSPSRQVTLRRSARDHTPRPDNLCEGEPSSWGARPLRERRPGSSRPASG